MALDTESAFRFLQVNYKYGSLDKLGKIIGDVLDELLLETGSDFEDVINRIEGISDKMLDRVEKLVPLLLRLIPLLANEHVTKIESRMLDIPLMRRTISAVLKRYLAWALGLKGKGKRRPVTGDNQTIGG